VFFKYKALLVIFILLLLALVIFFFLQDRGMSEDRFIEIYIQLSLVNEEFKDNPEKLEAERKKIFSEYKFSQKELDKFLQSYRKNPERWVRLWEKINQHLSELIERNKIPQSK